MTQTKLFLIGIIISFLLVGCASTAEQQLTCMKKIAQQKGCIEGFSVSLISPSYYICQNDMDREEAIKAFPRFYKINEYQDGYGLCH